ncbi:hypothetical protein TRAPUB_3107, partial [Trametes pubescens]
MPERHIDDMLLDNSTRPPEVQVINTDIHDPNVGQGKASGDHTESRSHCDQGRINKKAAQLATYVRLGLLDGRGINLEGLPVPAAKEPTHTKASVQTKNRPPALSQRFFKQWPAPDPLRAPAVIQVETRPPGEYVATHPRATIGVGLGAPPPQAVLPIDYYQTPRSHASTPFTAQSQTTSSSRVKVNRASARHHDDARPHDGARGHPYSRPRPARDLQYVEQAAYGRTVAPSSGTLYEHVGDGMLQTHISEQHSYHAQLFASMEARPEPDFRGTIRCPQEPTFTRQAVTSARSLSIDQENSSRFAPTYGVPCPPEQHVRARVEYGPEPSHVETTYFQTYNNIVRWGTVPHRPNTASTTSTESNGTIDAPYVGFNDPVVNNGFEHTFTEPRPEPLPIPLPQLQHQDEHFPSTGLPLSMPQQSGWTYVKTDVSPPTSYKLPSDNNLRGPWVPWQPGQGYFPAQHTDIGTSGHAPGHGLDHSSTNFLPQDAKFSHSTAPQVQAYNAHLWENPDQPCMSDAAAGRQHGHVFAAEDSWLLHRQGTYGPFLYDAATIETPTLARGSPLWAGQPDDPFAHSAPELAQLAYYQEVAPCPRSMFALDDSAITYPALPKLGHARAADLWYEPGYNDAADIVNYSIPKHDLSADSPSLHAFVQSAFVQHPDVSY